MGSVQRSQQSFAFTSVVRMLHEELPHYPGGIDFNRRPPGPTFRSGFGAWPGVAAALDRIENYVRILGVVGVCETADARRDSIGRTLDPKGEILQ